VQGLGLSVKTARKLPKLEFPLPPGFSPGEYCVALLCPLPGSDVEAVQFLWPGVMRGVDGGPLVCGACGQKPQLWRKQHRTGGALGRLDWAAAPFDDDISRQTVGCDADGVAVEARQSWLPILRKDPALCSIPVVSIRKGAGRGPRATMLGANGQGVVNPLRAYKPAEGGKEDGWAKKREELLSEEPTWGAASQKVAWMKVVTALVQEALGVGDGEQGLETLRLWEECGRDWRRYASMFSTTLNADAVCAHFDRSKKGSSLAEMEALYNVSLPAEDAERVGLGRIESEDSGRADRAEIVRECAPAARVVETVSGVLCLVNHGVLLVRRPTL
jgi:hypothetical protein